MGKKNVGPNLAFPETSNINTEEIVIYKIKETVDQRCSVKKVFLENAQNLRENTCARVSFLMKFQA